MNKLLTKAAKLLLGLSLAAGVGVAIGSKAAERVDALVANDFVSLANGKGVSGGNADLTTSAFTVSSSGITLSFNNAFGSSSSQLRVYKNSSITLTYDSTVDSISAISMTATGTNYTGTTWTGATISSTTITWSSTSNNTTITATGGQARLSAISITYTAAASTPTLSVSPESLILLNGASQSLTATAQNGTGSVGWQTSNAAIASISTASGNSTTVTGEAPGYATITSSYSTASNVLVKVLVKEHAGTQADPYSVADSRNAIDVGLGLSNVYAIGKVSAIPTAYNSQYGNITFNFVDVSGDTNFIQAYRCTGTDAADVAVGDTVLVSGTLLKHNSTYEFGEGCTLVTLTPASGSINITFDSDGGTDPDPISRDSGETFAFPGAGTKANYIFKGWSSDGGTTVYAEGATSPAVVDDIEYVAIWQTEGTEADPYTVTEARAAITSGLGVKGAYATGIVSAINEAYSAEYSNITFSFSVDGDTNSDQLKAYRCTGTDAADVTVGDTVVVTGNLILHSSDYEFAQGCVLTELTHPVVVTHDVTYSAGSNGSGSYVHADQTEGTYSLLPFASLTGVSASSGYRFKSYTLNGDERAPGYEFTLDSDVSITVNFEVIPSGTEVSTTIADYASNNSWVNSTTQYFTINLDPVTLTAAGGGNTGKYYSSDESWRLYASSNDTLTISVPSGCTLVSTTLTFSGTLTFGGNNVSSGSEVSLSGTSAVFTVTANVKITEISVLYSGSAASYTITYDSNGGSGTMESTTGSNPAVASCTFTAPSGKEFSKWNSQSDGEGDDYAVGATVSQNITLYAIWSNQAVNPSEYFTKITSTSDISDGKYVIAYDAENIIFDGSLTSLDAISNYKEMTLANLLTSYFTFEDDGVKAASGKYIGKSSYANGLDSSDAVIEHNAPSISDGNVVISVTTSGGDVTLKYNKTSGQTRFRYYKSGQEDIQLYKVNFEKVLLELVTCNAQGTSEPTGTSWATLESYFNTLSTSEKNALKTSSSDAMAKYDYIVGKYNPTNNNSSTYKNFIGRTVTPVGGARLALGSMAENSNTIAIIVIISLVSVTAIGGYFFIKRKEVE